MKNLHQLTLDHKMVYADTSVEDEQLLIRPLLRKIKKKYEHGGQLTFKI
jgi:hypothetical protein